ncbi:MAG: hypothetical protein ACOYXC_16880 [Candidatus Rifleibacteriota bacterium]
MRNLTIWLVILSFFVFGTEADAGIAGIEYVHYGDYTFLLEVHSEYEVDVWGEKYELTVNGDVARFDVEAPGYMPNHEEIKLDEEKKVYSVTVRLEDPAVKMAIGYGDGAPVEGCVFKEEKPEHLYFGDEYGFRGTFPVVEGEKLFACNFMVYVNGNEIDSGTPVYLDKIGGNWLFEVVVPREKLDAKIENKFEIVVYRFPKTVPSSENLFALAVDYTKNLQRLSEMEDEETILILQSRLKSNADQLIHFYDDLDVGEQRNIFDYLPDRGDLLRELKSKWNFAELHR